jgi:hypothetical protein
VCQACADSSRGTPITAVEKRVPSHIDEMPSLRASGAGPVRGGALRALQRRRRNSSSDVNVTWKSWNARGPRGELGAGRRGSAGLGPRTPAVARRYVLDCDSDRKPGSGWKASRAGLWARLGAWWLPWPCSALSSALDSVCRSIGLAWGRPSWRDACTSTSCSGGRWSTSRWEGFVGACEFHAIGENAGL